MVEFKIVILESDLDRLNKLVRAVEVTFSTVGLSSGAELFEQLPKIQPDLLLIDFNLQDMNCIELQNRIKKEHPGIYTAMISSVDRSKCVVESMKKRAMDYIFKSDDMVRFHNDVCKLIRFIIEDSRRKKTELLLKETGMYSIFEKIYNQRDVDVEELRKEIQEFKKNQ